MLSLLVWLKDRWYIPLLAAAAIALFLWRRQKKPLQQLGTHLEAIAAGAEARVLREELGAREASVRVLEKYDAEVQALDVRTRREAKTLKADPEELARFLVHAAADPDRQAKPVYVVDEET